MSRLILLSVLILVCFISNISGHWWNPDPFGLIAQRQQLDAQIIGQGAALQQQLAAQQANIAGQQANFDQNQANLANQAQNFHQAQFEQQLNGQMQRNQQATQLLAQESQNAAQNAQQQQENAARIAGVAAQQAQFQVYVAPVEQEKKVTAADIQNANNLAVVAERQALYDQQQHTLTAAQLIQKQQMDSAAAARQKLINYGFGAQGTSRTKAPYVLNEAEIDSALEADNEDEAEAEVDSALEADDQAETIGFHHKGGGGSSCWPPTSCGGGGGGSSCWPPQKCGGNNNAAASAPNPANLPNGGCPEGTEPHAPTADVAATFNNNNGGGGASCWPPKKCGGGGGSSCWPPQKCGGGGGASCWPPQKCGGGNSGGMWPGNGGDIAEIDAALEADTQTAGFWGHGGGGGGGSSCWPPQKCGGGGGGSSCWPPQKCGGNSGNNNQPLKPTCLPKVTRDHLNSAQVAEHNTVHSCYMILTGIVFDMTSYLTTHPGGKSPLEPFCGKDASEPFQTQHKGHAGYLDSYGTLIVGPLVESPEEKQQRLNQFKVVKADDLMSKVAELAAQPNPVPQPVEPIQTQVELGPEEEIVKLDNTKTSTETTNWLSKYEKSHPKPPPTPKPTPAPVPPKQEEPNQELPKDSPNPKPKPILKPGQIIGENGEIITITKEDNTIDFTKDEQQLIPDVPKPTDQIPPDSPKPKPKPVAPVEPVIDFTKEENTIETQETINKPKPPVEDIPNGETPHDPLFRPGKDAPVPQKKPVQEAVPGVNAQNPLTPNPLFTPEKDAPIPQKKPSTPTPAKPSEPLFVPGKDEPSKKPDEPALFVPEKDEPSVPGEPKKTEDNEVPNAESPTPNGIEGEAGGVSTTQDLNTEQNQSEKEDIIRGADGKLYRKKTTTKTLTTHTVTTKRQKIIHYKKSAAGADAESSTQTITPVEAEINEAAALDSANYQVQEQQPQEEVVEPVVETKEPTSHHPVHPHNHPLGPSKIAVSVDVQL